MTSTQNKCIMTKNQVKQLAKNIVAETGMSYSAALQHVSKAIGFDSYQAFRAASKEASDTAAVNEGDTLQSWLIKNYSRVTMVLITENPMAPPVVYIAQPTRTVDQLKSMSFDATVDDVNLFCLYNVESPRYYDEPVKVLNIKDLMYARSTADEGMTLVVPYTTNGVESTRTFSLLTSSELSFSSLGLEDNTAYEVWENKDTCLVHQPNTLKEALSMVEKLDKDGDSAICRGNEIIWLDGFTPRYALRGR